jgi:hypothetical protein
MSDPVSDHWQQLPNGAYLNVSVPQIVRKRVSKTGYVLSYAPPPDLYQWELAEVTVGGQLFDSTQAKPSLRRASLIPAARRPVTYAVHTWADQPADEARASQSCSLTLLAAFASHQRVKVEGYQLVLQLDKQVTLTFGDGSTKVLPGTYVDAFVRDFMHKNPNPYVTRVTYLQ